VTFKSFGVIAIAILIALGVGWFWGASGKSGVSAERRALEERATIAEARVALHDARMSLRASNFGEAAKHLEAARMLATGLQARLREVGQPERAGHVEIVLAHVRDAERMTSALDRAAENATAQADDALRNLAPVTSQR
jgi:hypothetical protein